MSESLEARVRKYLSKRSNIDGMKFKSNETIENVLKKEAERFRGILKKHVNDYYASYKPKVYHRTNGDNSEGNMAQAISISENLSKMQITVFFNKDVYHKSIIDPSLDKRFVPTLIDSGWSWKGNSLRSGDSPSGSSYRIYRFTEYDGYHFIQKAVDEFYKNNPYNIKITINSKYNADYYNNLSF